MKTNPSTLHPARSIWLRFVTFLKGHPYLASFLAGCAYFGFTISWMFSLRTAEIAQGIGFQIVTWTAGIIMVSSFASGLLCFVWLYRRLRVSITGSRWWLIPFLWVVGEFFRAIFFSIVALGPGGRIGPYWTFGSLGYWLVHTPFVYASRIGGLYMLSLITAAFIAGLIRAILTRRITPLLIPMAAASLISLLGWWLYRVPTGPSVKIGVMQFANEFSPEAFSTTTADELAKVPERQYDTLLLPEYSHLWEKNAERDTQAISRVLKDPSGLVIDSVQELSTNTQLGHNLITYHAADGAPLYTQQKWFSIPGGEYVPYLYQVILAYVGQEQLLLHFEDQKSINHGETPELPYEYRGVKWGAMACSGVIAPELYRGMVDRGASVLTNSASLDTMGLGMQYHYQSRDMAELHAVANARPFAQAARGGLSYIIDQDGRFIERTDERGYAFLEADIHTNTTKTIYTLAGDWVVWLALAIVAAACMIGWKPLRLYRKPRKSKQ